MYLIGAFCRKDQHKDLRVKMENSQMQGSYKGELRLSLRISSDWFGRRSLRQELIHRKLICIHFHWVPRTVNK